MHWTHLGNGPYRDGMFDQERPFDVERARCV